MAQAARAYSYNAPARLPVRPERPPVRVVPGRKPRTDIQTIPSTLVTLTKAVAVILVVVALLGFTRIAIASATVTTSIQSQQLTNQIDDARSSASDLEVAQSRLSNPSNVKNEATRLKMAAPESVSTINLGADVVATDATGKLSLSQTARNAAGIAG